MTLEAKTLKVTLKFLWESSSSSRKEFALESKGCKIHKYIACDKVLVLGQSPVSRKPLNFY